MVLNDEQIRMLAQRGMIEPFVDSLVSAGTISYGLSSFGYDIRCAPEWQVFLDLPGQSYCEGDIVDPKRWSNLHVVPYRERELVLPPGGFALTRSVEYIRMPDDVIAIAMAKSTYARCGLVVGVTPIEPGWEGHITLELSNTTPRPIRVYADEGICQLVFLRGQRPQVTYAERKGKYQGQRGITPPRVSWH